MSATKVQRSSTGNTNAFSEPLRGVTYKGRLRCKRTNENPMGAQRTKPKKNLLAQTKAGAKMRIMQCRIKYFAQLAAAAFWLLAASVPYAAGGQSELSIPSEGNSYVTKIDGEKKTASLWFKAEKPGTLELALRVKCENPSQEIRAAVAGRRGKKIMPDSRQSWENLCIVVLSQLSQM